MRAARVRRSYAAVLDVAALLLGTLLSAGHNASVPECAGMSLDEDERLRSDAEVERVLRSVAPGS